MPEGARRAVSLLASDGAVSIIFGPYDFVPFAVLTIRDRFIKTHKKGWDFHQIWLRLCRDDPRAKVVIRSYFCHYVRRSQVNRPALGEEEYETVQMINCTKTVIDHWKNLVAEADNTVLRAMRRKDPDNYRLWKLRWDRGEPKDRPVADISNV